MAHWLFFTANRKKTAPNWENGAEKQYKDYEKNPNPIVLSNKTKQR